MDRQLNLSLTDDQWPYTYTDHDRQIARAIVFDDADSLLFTMYFVRAERNDDFGEAMVIETAGGGVEPGEEPTEAIVRELREELGAEVEVVCKLGVVEDYYNLIHRHNINHYFLCRVRSLGENHLTKDEAEVFHLSTWKLTYEEAAAEYEKRAATKLGRLIANRELPVLHHAMAVLRQRKQV